MRFILRHPFIITFLLALALLLAAVYAVPWRSAAEKEALGLLAINGFPSASLHVTRLDASGMEAENIALGDPAPLEIAGAVLDLGGKGLALRLKAMRYPLPHGSVTAEKGLAEASGDIAGRRGEGTWKLENIRLDAGDLALPPLAGEGPFRIDSQRFELEGTLKSADGNYNARFKLAQDFAAPEKSSFDLLSATLPWNKGRLSTRDVRVPLGRKEDIHLTLAVEHVPVDALMQMLTGAQTPATGVVSGSLPVTLHPDGRFDIGSGQLQTEGPGTITLAPEFIPGEGEQMTLIRDIMKNLHYQVLSIAMQPGAAEDGKPRGLSVLMALEGNNPDVAQGRAVKLNVQLKGDVLNLIQQSLLSLIDPNLFLKEAAPATKDEHAKP